MKKLFLILGLLIFVASIAGGCAQDPTDAELKKGAGFSTENVNGKIIQLWVDYTNDKQPNYPYYCAKILAKNEGGKEVEEIYRGIPSEVFQNLYVEEVLPASTFISHLQLAKLEGTIVDKQAYLNLNKFFIVVDDGLEVKMYHVNMLTYYKLVDVGMKLPIVVVK